MKFLQRKCYCFFSFVCFCSLLLFTACNTEVNDAANSVDNELVVEKNLEYTEYYPGKKQVKMHGFFDENKKRHGVWEYFSPEGIKLSVCMYEHGLRDGHSMVFYSNGAQQYIGEYENDKKVGEWRTFDEQGNLISTKNF